MTDSLAIVVIGRNEGDRLVRCLRSCLGRAGAVVYVDSGSSDGSVRAAVDMGAEVVELDMSTPFTAARARNAGFERARGLLGDRLAAVQFVDGDCEIVPGWLETGLDHIARRRDVAVVVGRLRERFPEASIYNRLCDVEWNLPIGEIDVCGGVCMIRADAFERAGGFDSALIAGEEPELCVRLRAAGGRVVRIDHDMARHDAAMTRFSQWWKRSVRAGHAYAEGAALHGRNHWLRPSLGIWFWGLLLPAAAIALAWPTRGVSVALAALLYGVLVYRAYRGALARADAPRHALLYAVFCAIAKWPMAIGQIRYWTNRLAGRRSTIIEHKGASAAATDREPAAPAVSRQA